MRLCISLIYCLHSYVIGFHFRYEMQMDQICVNLDTGHEGIWGSGGIAPSILNPGARLR
jgi:hypothetical protein